MIIFFSLVAFSAAYTASPEQLATVPLMVQQYIAANYRLYGQEKLTYRLMKQNVADKLGITFLALKGDRELELTIEEEVDNIQKACDGGKSPVECVQSMISQTLTVTEVKNGATVTTATTEEGITHAHKDSQRSEL